MINKSAAYNAAINANTRMSDFTASFAFVPPGAVEGSTVTTSSAASYSDPTQLNNGITQMGAVWENLGDWVLDDNNLIINGSGEYGFWSSALSAADRSVSSCYVDYTMADDYDIVAVTIAFDELADEYATAFTVAYYDSGSSLITSTSVNNNTDAIAVVDLLGQAVARIRVTITEWCLPNARPRIAEITPGKIFQFDLNNLYAIQSNDIAKPFANSFEVSELDIQFDNSDHAFDFLNPSGVFAYLRQQMQITSLIGINIGGTYDWTSAGDRYLWEIPSNQQMQAATLVCRPSVSFATNDVTRVGSGTIATAAAGLWALTGYPERIIIDPSLQNIACNRYIGENVNINDALAALALAAGGWWKVHRNGDLEMLPITTSIGMPVYTMTYDEMFEKPKITQNALVTAVRIGYSYLNFDLDFASKQTIYTNGANTGAQVEAISFFTPNVPRAEAIGQLALDYHAARRLSFDISYRGNPALEVGDVISVETDYGFHNVEILEHNLTLDGNGFLRGRIRGVG